MNTHMLLIIDVAIAEKLNTSKKYHPVQNRL